MVTKEEMERFAVDVVEAPGKAMTFGLAFGIHEVRCNTGESVEFIRRLARHYLETRSGRELEASAYLPLENAEVLLKTAQGVWTRGYFFRLGQEHRWYIMGQGSVPFSGVTHWKRA